MASNKQYISGQANEGSTYVVTVDFTDEDGNPLTPATVNYSLYTEDEVAITGRQAEPVTPDTSVDIVLSGTDLSIPDTAELGAVIVKVYGTYDSAYGTGLPYTFERYIQIRKVVGEDEPVEPEP